MIETERLILRQWQESDLQPFAELNACPDVMRYFPAPLSREESDNLAKRFKNIIDTNQGWGFWAVELKATKEFVGTVGLLYQADRFSFSPCTEIGWRLAKTFWHQGIALEAATRSLNFAFNQLHLDEVVSFTSVHNAPSEGLMKRLGMVKQASFIHPALPASHKLAEHVLYKITRMSLTSKIKR
ncbi:GNAT family N-acetyltransferase [Klebsiella sp. BIGb0407]|uniref:GNAT family N-acetyltransferase n=1 Tax=Klebsiella sp. BIGb0407 TaxID=2940603 RepID=UPI00216AB0B9|nr:GNAT family N-acetyltransferase [Klebsiella sp. BIGb0407]MCS3432418.1 RimJ/RimL family protein N-acetyltransferase [Klebsiella sp. BIGb0407]